MSANKMPESERGEGNYKASKDYDSRSEKFVSEKGQDIERMAREAAEARAGEEGDELRRAEEEGKRHARR